MLTLEERFWAKVDRRGPDDCWPWTGATNEHGYGVLHRSDGGSRKAPRIAAELAGMAIAGRVVRHRCDNPPCVNAAHLLAGTQQQNVADMHQRGRGNVGVRNGMARHSDDVVAEVRRRVVGGERQSVVADSLGLSRQTVSTWIKGRSRAA